MRKLWDNKVSRRKLLGGAAATGAALPVLHELVPHRGLHGGTSAAQAAVEHHQQAHRGSGHIGAVGRVTTGQRLRPAGDPARLRRGGRQGRRSRVGDRRRGPRDRGGSRRQVRRLDLQRARARADAPRPRGRAPAGSLRERLEAPAHDALPRHPPRRDGRHPGDRCRQHRGGRLDDLRVRRHAVRAPPLPLPLHAAGGPHRQGALRRVHHRSEGGPPRRRRARHGHERVRHELRPLERGLRRQHGRVRVHGRAGPGQARRAGADLPRQRARVRPRSTRSTSTPTSSTTTRPARGSSRATSPTR